jgi:hypothetical protein
VCGKHAAGFQYAVNLGEGSEEALVIALPPKVLKHAIGVAFVERVIAKRPGILFEVVNHVSAAARVMVDCGKIVPIVVWSEPEKLCPAVAAADQKLRQPSGFRI